MSNILIVVAHPDDEVLGVGGTSLKHSEQGDNVYVLILCSPRSKDNFEMVCASEVLKTTKLFNMKYEDQNLDKIDIKIIVENIETIVTNYEIDTIYTHTHKDLNKDHQITNEAVLIATRPMGYSSVKKVLAFETPSSTEWNFNSCFKPNYYLNINGTIIKKLEALSMYESELRDYPHPRSIENVENISRLRGCSVGMMNAEAFEVVRIIEY